MFLCYFFAYNCVLTGTNTYKVCLLLFLSLHFYRQTAEIHLHRQGMIPKLPQRQPLRAPLRPSPVQPAMKERLPVLHARLTAHGWHSLDVQLKVSVSLACMTRFG